MPASDKSLDAVRLEGLNAKVTLHAKVEVDEEVNVEVDLDSDVYNKWILYT